MANPSNRTVSDRGGPCGPVVGRRSFLAGATTFAVSGFSLPGLLDRGRPSPRELLAFFDTVGLMRSSPDGPARPGWVRKWTRPVEVRIHGTPERRDLAAIESILTTLSRWTGLPFDLSPVRDAADDGVDLYFRDRREMDERYGVESRTVCHCETYGNSGAIHTGGIEVSIGFTDCLPHEFMHALGFDNHWTGAPATERMPSVLALRDAAARADRFTYCDELAVRILYDPRLRPGMKRDAALAPASRALADLIDV